MTGGISAAFPVTSIHNPKSDFFMAVRRRIDDLSQVDIGIGDLDDENAIRFEVPPVNSKAFLRQEVRWNGVAVECINHENIVLLRAYVL